MVSALSVSLSLAAQLNSITVIMRGSMTDVADSAPRYGLRLHFLFHSSWGLMYGHWDPKVISLLNALLTSPLLLILALKVLIMGKCMHAHTHTQTARTLRTIAAALRESLEPSQGGGRDPRVTCHGN